MANNLTNKLIPEDVLDIYDRAWAGEPQSSIRKDHMISQATVTSIKHGYYWNHVTGHAKTRISERQGRILDIYSEYWDKKRPVPEIAAEFGVSLTCVYDIRNGKTGAQITGHPNPKLRGPRKVK